MQQKNITKEVVAQHVCELADMIVQLDVDTVGQSFMERIVVQLNLINDCVLFTKQMVQGVLKK